MSKQEVSYQNRQYFTEWGYDKSVLRVKKYYWLNERFGKFARAKEVIWLGTSDYKDVYETAVSYIDARVAAEEALNDNS